MPFKMKSSPLHQMESDSQQRDDLIQDMPIDEDASPLNQGLFSKTVGKDERRKFRKDKLDERISGKEPKSKSGEHKDGSDVGNFLRRARKNFGDESQAKGSSTGKSGDTTNINIGGDGGGGSSSSNSQDEYNNLISNSKPDPYVPITLGTYGSPGGGRGFVPTGKSKKDSPTSMLSKFFKK